MDLKRVRFCQTPPRRASPPVLDAIMTTTIAAYAQALGLDPSDVADDRLLTWCLNEIEDIYDPDNPVPGAAYAEAIGAMEQTLRDLQAIIDALNDQLEAPSI